MPALEIGDLVQARAPLGVSNGARVVPAVVTKIWDHVTVLGHSVWVVNLRVFHDGPETLWRTSVYVFEDEKSAATVPGWNAWLKPPSEVPHVD